MVQVFPRSSPQDEATTDLVHRLRDDIIPRSAGNGGADGGAVHVGGVTPTFIDLGTALMNLLSIGAASASPRSSASGWPSRRCSTPW